MNTQLTCTNVALITVLFFIFLPKGPALYAYNNAVFTDEDWERIQMAGRSGKVNDPNKIGRFGIGFNSVYHITGKTCVLFQYFNLII